MERGNANDRRQSLIDLNSPFLRVMYGWCVRCRGCGVLQDLHRKTLRREDLIRLFVAGDSSARIEFDSRRSHWIYGEATDGHLGMKAKGVSSHS